MVNVTCAMAKIPTFDVDIRSTYVGNNRPIANRIPVLKTELDCTMALVRANEAIKSTLIISSSFALLRSKRIREGMNAYENNMIRNCKSLQEDLIASIN